MLEHAFNLYRSGNFDDCAAVCWEILTAAEDNFETAHYLLGLIQLMRGDSGGGAFHLEQFIRVRPYEPDAFNRLSMAYHLSGQRMQALRASACAIVLRPDFQDSYHHLATALSGGSFTGFEVRAWYRADALDPLNPFVLKNYGAALVASNSFERALPVLHAALAIDPTCTLTRYNLAMTAFRLAEYDQATPFARQSAADRPDDSEVWLILAGIGHRLGHWQEALKLFRRAEILAPHMPSARLNQALLLLTLGDFDRGLKLHEARLETPQVQAPPEALRIERLRSLDSDVTGKSILIWAEQGLGDSIQFCRYLPLLVARGMRLTFLVQSPLKDLIKRLEPSIEVATHGDPVGQFDFHCPLMSLPLLFMSTLASIPSSTPYLSADPTLVALWNTELGPKARLRIGLAWSGNPAHTNDRNRSIPFDLLMPLFEIGDVEFHCLKYDLSPEELARAAAFPNLVCHASDRLTMASIAALIEIMDLVITVDTSIAHLAGALGKPVWILLPHVPDWRWLLDRTDSPWYPSARLFRQTVDRKWSITIGSTIMLLTATIQNH
jgi:tetratricopeptide (TPR) repeat protein